MNFKYYNTKALVMLIALLSVFWIGIDPCQYLPKNLTKYNDILSWLSPMAFISVIIWCINQHLWKYSFIKWLIDLPNLNGVYEGELTSSYPNDVGIRTEKKCKITITHNAHTVHIQGFYFDIYTNEKTSDSTNINHEITKLGDGRWQLSYQYQNTPSIMDTNTLHNHRGQINFIYSPNESKLEGEYYNERQNKGKIWIQKI